MYLRPEMRHGSCGRNRIEEQLVEHSAYIYSRRRFLRSSSRSVTVPSTILLSSNSDSGNELKGRRGGRFCCIRLTSENVCEMFVLMLNTNKVIRRPSQTPRPTSKVTTAPTNP